MRRRRKILLLAAALSLPACLLTFCVGPPSYYSAKYAPSPLAPRPAPLPAPIAPEVQTEPHTCGLHSLSAIYTAYGLDPAALRLRFRLGADKPANTLFPASRGTIPPDMLRVLRQDGFDPRILLPGSEQTRHRLRTHLDAGHPAVALVRPRGFHWLVIASREGDDAVVCDSLRADPYRVSLDPYLRDEVYSLLLVAPAPR